MGATIVLADDEPDLRAVYAGALRLDGHEVHEAAEGQEALDLVVSRNPSVLILDVWMPGLNGFEVLDRLKYQTATGTMKVVMLSNLADGDAHLEGFSSGATDYWVKGLSLDELRDRVRRLVSDLNHVRDSQ